MPATTLSPGQAVIDIDLDAIAANVGALCERVAGTPVMAVIKADGYGHGLIPSARAALAGGAQALGVTTLDEARSLREGGINARVLSWLHSPGTDFSYATGADIELGLSTLEAVQAAASTGTKAVVHLKIDTGLGRAGATSADWPLLVAQAAQLVADGKIEVRGIWSHFAYADAPGHPTVQAQRVNLRAAAQVAREAGLDGFELHLANSAATLTDPEAFFDMVRPGIAIYGLDPMGGDPAAYGLRPAMRVSAGIMMTKRVPEGTGVSYGHAYVTDKETTLAVVPVGYADGIPRAAGNLAPVLINGRRFTISGRVCMDQFVVDVGDHRVEAGDEAVLWGDAAAGEPTAQEWADLVGTIHYELVARIGGRFDRRYRGALAADGSGAG